MLFSDSDGNLDMQLVDTAGTTVASGTSFSNNELIEINALDAGDYYIRVYPRGASDTGNSYDLRWTTKPDDAYEDNDSILNPYDLSTHAGVWLEGVDGEGAAYDDDWYKVTVPAGTGRLSISLRFSNSDGNLDMQLVDTAGTTVASGTSFSNNELIEINALDAGDYYIRVYPRGASDTGNSYDLQWTTISGPIGYPNCNLDDTIE